MQNDMRFVISEVNALKLLVVVMSTVHSLRTNGLVHFADHISKSVLVETGINIDHLMKEMP